METKCKFSYSNIDDSLIISCNENNESAKENFIFDDIIFYLVENGEIIGLQIRNTSSFLSEAGLNEDILDNLNEVYLTIIPKENNILININLISDTKKEKLSLGRIFVPQ